MWSISPAFREALTAPVHTMAVKAQVLDPSFNVVDGGEFYSVSTERFIQNYIVDGNVDVDTGRATRRNFTLQLLNEDGEFSPNSNWAGLFYVNRLVRLWRGIDFGTSVEWVPIGTFFIDHADVIVERNMSMVTLSGSDGWKQLTKAQLGYTKNYAVGTGINVVIKDLAQRAGVSFFLFDPLLDRTSDERTLNVALKVERDDLLGEVITKLAHDFGIDVYFDALGRLTTQDFRSPEDQATVWSYEPGETNNLLSLRVSYKDDNLYNHVMIVGTGDKDNIVVANRQNTDPASPTSISNIGRRTLKYESEYISTQAAAEAAADYYYLRHVTVDEDVTGEAICNPAFEGNDVVSVVEEDFTGLDRRYRLKSFSIPLASSRQTFKLTRAIDVSGA